MAPKNTVATTFNMQVDLKEQAQIYVVTQNRIAKEHGLCEKTNLGILLNKSLEYYLDKTKKKELSS